MRKHLCTAGCRCPKCDDTMAAVMAMDTDSYARWLQKATAAMLAAAPKGPNFRAAIRHMSDYATGEQATAYRTVQAQEAQTPARPAPRTPLHVVRAMVRAKKAEIRREVAQRQRDAEGQAVRRRVRNEIASDFEYVRQNPVTNGYSEALASQLGSEPMVDIYEHGPVPCPYTLALGEIVPRRAADGSPVRLPEGDEPPDPYTLALEARRLRDRKDNWISGAGLP